MDTSVRTLIKRAVGRGPAGVSLVRDELNLIKVSSLAGMLNVSLFTSAALIYRRWMAGPGRIDCQTGEGMNKRDSDLEQILPPAEPTRTGLSVAAIRQAFLDNLYYIQGRSPEVATAQDRYNALAYTLRDRLLKRWLDTVQPTSRPTVARSATCRGIPARAAVGPQPAQPGHHGKHPQGADRTGP